ncbi:hypothetical protein, partial [Niallia sp. MER TA 168]|uniref:hypothetical protein n=1 Tax=Niallia sp. MER TA 168 TaxID=2939568 RepID=UPI00203AFA9A
QKESPFFFIFAHTTALAFGWRSNDHQPNQRVNYFLPTNILLIPFSKFKNFMIVFPKIQEKNRA